MSAEPRWRRLEPDERRRQILSCAVRLFGERQFEDVSTTDIAREAGVARGLINHYFGTKKDLYLEVVRLMVTIPDEALLGLPDGDLQTRADASVEWFLDVVSEHAEPWLAVIGTTGSARYAEVAQILAEADDETADTLLFAMGVVDGARPRHHGAPEELRALMRMYVGLCRTASVEWLVRGSLSRRQVHLLLSRTLVNLLQDTYPRLPRSGG